MAAAFGRSAAHHVRPTTPAVAKMLSSNLDEKVEASHAKCETQPKLSVSQNVLRFCSDVMLSEFAGTG